MFSKDDVFIYIFSWKKVTDNAKALYAQVATACPNTWFVNCDENIQITFTPNVIQLDDSYYYGSQFETAIRHVPKGKLFGVIVGDVTPDAEWNTIINNMVAAFNTGKVGVYAPNVDYTYHTTRNQLLWGSLYDVNNTDCTCWFMNPSIVNTLYHLPFSAVSNLGWGIDTICMKEAVRQNLCKARDYSVMVRQPRGTAYNGHIAGIQMNQLLEMYNLFIRCVNTPKY
jgi:hypothetical protein